MEAGWSATGRIEPLWKRLDPPNRETLGALTGIQPGTLSGYNTGRLKLGMANAEKIAQAAGVSIYDLGAPQPIESDFAASLLGRIVSELEARPPRGMSGHLRELAASLRAAADQVDAVADAQDAEPPPG